MGMITILFIALGLSMDAFAVSVASGSAIKRLKVKNALKISFFFGFFQMFMPIVGWLCGVGLKDFISGIDHWIAFGLLSFIGIKMIFESRELKDPGESGRDVGIYLLLVLSLATSIDALAVGLSLSMLAVSIITPAIVIGIVTFLLSLAGFFIGGRFGHFLESRIEVAGGLILIGIGIKILIQHLF